MGPFVPDVISNELNLLFAFIIGIAFGFILEQAGFSSSKKLAGVFYGYDFVVLRVFFTAAVTAMSGLMIFEHYGLIDPDLIFVNPLFMKSAIIGGLIMGLGFIIGGFCPGTSVCAAAIGKVDAMVFVGGVFLGAVIFAEGYPMFVDTYKADPLGGLRIYESLGMSKGMFATVMILVAVGAFIVTTLIEKRVNKQTEKLKIAPWHKPAIGGALVIGLLMLFLPDWKTNAMEQAMVDDIKQIENINVYSSDELVQKLLDESDLLIIDVRSAEEFKKLNIPRSINIPLKEILNSDWLGFFNDNYKEIVFYSDKEENSRRAISLARSIDAGDARILAGGFSGYFTLYESNNQAAHTSEFRTNARSKLAAIRKQFSTEAMPKKKKRKISGGC